MGVCEKTFRKMIDALPATRRPKPVQYPGVTAKRWRVTDLDSAFARASASSGWDEALEGRSHAQTKRTSRSRVG